MDVERLWRVVCATLEAHGWKLLTATALLLVARAKYREYAQRAHVKRTLDAANGAPVCVRSWPANVRSSAAGILPLARDLRASLSPCAPRAIFPDMTDTFMHMCALSISDPTRVAVLQRETARIREAQQVRLAQTSRAKKLKASSSSTKSS